MTNLAKVIPFHFEKIEVRTLLLDDQLWFVASDVCEALSIVNTARALTRLDDDERGVHSMNTLGGTQNVSIVNESGLYSLILTSRKPEAKRFKKWVTAEVLPAIRQHGHYQDTRGRMDTLLGDVIGTTGLNVLDRVIEQKGQPVPHALQRSFKQTMKSRLRARFNVQRTELIPASQLADACNFIAAYAIEGEWLGRAPSSETTLDELDLAMLYVFCIDTLELVYVGEQMNPAFDLLRSPKLMNVPRCLSKCREVVAHLHERFGPQMEQAARLRGAFDGRRNLAAAGDPSQPIWIQHRA